MIVNMVMDGQPKPFETRVGNVYPVKGGRGMARGHMQILIAITHPSSDPYDCRGRMGLLLVIDKEGNPVGVNSYGLHYLDEQMPIAFADGVEEIEFTVRSL